MLKSRRGRSVGLLVASLVTVSLLLTNVHSMAAGSVPRFVGIARGELADDSIYFVMTDRFENGKKENDEAYLGGGVFRSGFEPTNIGYFHGGDFVGLTQRLSYIKELGFTSIWITPPVVNNFIQGDSAAYHGYWGTDFTTIDPHLGTESEFREFVRQAHALDMKVIVDIVANHTGDIISPKIGMYTYRSLSDFPYRDSRGKIFDPSLFAGRQSFPQLDAKKSFPYQPFVATANRRVKKPDFLNDVTNYHNRGDSTFSGESSFYGDFFGLDDLFTEKPAVVKGMTELWSSWITRFDIDGYRIDTAKHVNPEFWQAFLPRIKERAKSAGKSEFPIFGEVADSDPAYLSSFLTDQEFPSILDFNFQSKAIAFVRSANQSYRLIELFNRDDFYTTPTTSAYSLPTFLGNHDMGRVGYFLYNTTFQNVELTLKRSLLGNEVLFFSRGAPVLYYGDEKGMTGTGGDKEARQSMFPTKVEAWKREHRIGSTPIADRSAFDVSNPLEDQIKRIQRLTQEHPALRSGTQEIRATTGSAVAMTRYLDGQEYLVIFNSAEEEGEIRVPVITSGLWRGIYGTDRNYETSDGNLKLSVPAISTFVLKAASRTPHPKLTSVTLKPPSVDYQTQNWVALKAEVGSDGYHQVNFQIREVGSKKWINLGTADRRTFPEDQLQGGLYRGYIKPREFPSGTKVEVIAIARNDAGDEARSKIRVFTIRY